MLLIRDVIVFLFPINIYLFTYLLLSCRSTCILKHPKVEPAVHGELAEDTVDSFKIVPHYELIRTSYKEKLY